MKMRQLIIYECLRCSHTWIPRITNPKKCPKCGSYEWREKKNGRNKS